MKVLHGSGRAVDLLACVCVCVAVCYSGMFPPILTRPAFVLLYARVFSLFLWAYFPCSRGVYETDLHLVSSFSSFHDSICPLRVVSFPCVVIFCFSQPWARKKGERV